MIDLSYAGSRSRRVVAATVVGSAIAMPPTVVRHPDRGDRFGRRRICPIGVVLVSRAAQLIVVAALPAVVGIGGSAYTDPEVSSRGFGNAMAIIAVTAAAGSAVDWLSTSDDVALDDSSEPYYHCVAESTPQA